MADARTNVDPNEMNVAKLPRSPTPLAKLYGPTTPAPVMALLPWYPTALAQIFNPTTPAPVMAFLTWYPRRWRPR